MISSEEWFASMSGDIIYCTFSTSLSYEGGDCICRYNAHWSSHAMQQTLLTLPSCAYHNLSRLAHFSIGLLELIMRDFLDKHHFVLILGCFGIDVHHCRFLPILSSKTPFNHHRRRLPIPCPASLPAPPLKLLLLFAGEYKRRPR